jgi:hypothetical protein
LADFTINIAESSFGYTQAFAALRLATLAAHQGLHGSNDGRVAVRAWRCDFRAPKKHHHFPVHIPCYLEVKIGQLCTGGIS